MTKLKLFIKHEIQKHRIIILPNSNLYFINNIVNNFYFSISNIDYDLIS
jgi:hypothetical protein